MFGLSDRELACLAELDVCDGYVVLVVDPVTGDSDAHGPFSGPVAAHDADARRREFDAENLWDVLVSVVRLHHPTPAPPPQKAC